MKHTIKEGDEVTFVADSSDASSINAGMAVHISPSQIIRVTPAPFDWKDARPGMAFKMPNYNYIGYLIGRDIRAGYESYVFRCEHGTEGIHVFTSALPRDVKRAPEHDLPEVK